MHKCYIEKDCASNITLYKRLYIILLEFIDLDLAFSIKLFKDSSLSGRQKCLYIFKKTLMTSSNGL